MLYLRYKTKISSRIRDHIGTKQHINALTNCQNVQRIDDNVNELNQIDEREDQFRDKLLTALTCSNIPISKLSSPSFRNFIQWLIDSPKLEVKVPHPRTLNKNLEKKRDEIIDKIRKIIEDKDVYLMMDETPDAESRNVINVMVGVLNGYETKPMLVNVTFESVVDNVTIQKVVIETCAILWPSKVFFPNLKLIISDQAMYMICAVKKLKENVLFPNLLHISCVIHAVHLVCDSIRKEHSTLNTFFSREKKVFKHSGKRKRLFKSITGLNLIPFPILIRWGSWLRCVNYHIDGGNFDKITQFFNGAPQNELPLTEDVIVIQKMLKGSKVANDLVNLSKYSKLPSLISKLETRSLMLSEQMKIVHEVQDIIRGTVHEQVLIKS